MNLQFCQRLLLALAAQIPSNLILVFATTVAKMFSNVLSAGISITMSVIRTCVLNVDTVDMPNLNGL